MADEETVINDPSKLKVGTPEASNADLILRIAQQPFGQEDIDFLQQASPDLLADKDFALKLVNTDPLTYQMLPDAMKADPDVALALAEKTAPLKPTPREGNSNGTYWLADNHAPSLKAFPGNRDFLKQVLTNSSISLVNFLPDSQGAWSDPELVKLELRRYPENLRYVTDANLKNAPETQAVVRAAFLHPLPFRSRPSLVNADASSCSDPSIVAPLVAANAREYSYAQGAAATAPEVLAALRDAIANRRGWLEDGPLEYDHTGPQPFPSELLHDPSLAVPLAEMGGLALLPAAEQQDPDVVAAHVRAHIPPSYETPYASQTFNSTGTVTYEPILKSLDAPWQDNEKVVTASLEADPANLQFASDRLKGSPELVRMACRMDGTALQYASADQKKDLDTVLAAVQENGDARQYADPSLQNDPHVLQAALSELLLRSKTSWDDPDLAMKDLSLVNQVDPDWGRKPDTVLGLLDANVSPDLVIPAVDSALLKDPAFAAQAALHGGLSVLDHLPPETQNLPDVMAAALMGVKPQQDFMAVAVAENPAMAADVGAAPGMLPSALPPEVAKLLTDVSVAVPVLQAHPELYLLLDPVTQANPQVLSAAVPRMASLITHLPRSVSEDLPLMRDLIHANPLALDEMAPARRRALLQFDPSLETYCQRALKDPLAELNISFPERFGGDWTLLSEVMSNTRSSPRPDARPLAVCIYPKADHNGSFDSTDFEKLRTLSKRYRVVYAEASSASEAMQELRQLTSEKKASVLLLGGHGDRTALTLGSNDDSQWPDYSTTPEAIHAGTSEQTLNLARLNDCLIKGGDIYLASCLAGSGLKYRDNITNTIARSAWDDNVYSSQLEENELGVDPWSDRFKLVYDNDKLYDVPAHRRN